MTKPARHFYDFGPFRLDAVKRVLLRAGELVQMPPKVFEILLVLVEQGGQLVEKGELMRRVWPDSFVEEGNLPVNIFALRKALGDEGNQYIKTVPKRGYCFVAKVTEVRGAPPETNGSTPGPGFAALAASLDYQREIELPLTALPVESLKHTATRPDESQARTHRQEEVLDRLALAALDQRARVERGRKLYQPVIMISVLLLGLAAVAYFWMTRHQQSSVATGKVRSVAVLPFKVVSAEAGDEYLGPGLAATVATALTNLKQLTVRPIASTLKYGGESQDPLEAGRALQVDAVLEGSIRKTGDSLRLTVQLVRVTDSARLWELKSAEEAVNIMVVPQMIPGEIARVLELDWTREDQAALAKRQTSNLAAYQCYLKGQHLSNQITLKGEGVEYFEQAIQADPNYAEAHTGLATFLTIPVNAIPTKETLVKAKTAATRALALDANLAEAHSALGRAMIFCDWDWTGAKRELKRAIELTPNYAEAHLWYAIYLSALARHAEALAEIKLAQEMDPSSPRVNFYFGMTFLMARQYDEAINQFRKTPLEMGTVNQRVYLGLGLAYAKKSRYEEAIATFQKVLTRASISSQAKAHLAYAYAQSGQRAEAEKILAELSQPTEGPKNSHMVMAGAYACLGNMAKAFEHLDQAETERDQRLIYLKVDPILDCARSDPRFNDFMRRMGLAP